jgi:RNA polymerase sigma-70 factor (ECF subfamily)
MPNPTDEPRRAVEAAARRSYGKLLAFLAARTRDLAGAEDALSEAFASALATWPTQGVPRAPEAWLLQVARRKTLDAGRRRQVRQAAMDPLRMLAEAAGDPGPAIPDERLRLMFACAHPALDPAVRAPLMLQCVLGFDAVSIGTAFLVAPAAMGQRLVRAKRKIRDAGVPFRVPDPDELAARLDAVLDAIYAVFAAGWTDPALTEEAIWLGRLVVALLDGEPEALGLLALMLHVQARRPARRDANGTYIPLSAQNPADWQDELIEEAEALLLRASRLQRIGRFQFEAAIQSAHAARRLTGLTAWAEVVALYDALLARTESPVVALNRAVAVGELHGAAAGLAALDRVAADQRLADYQPYWAARATLLADTGDADAADAAYARAIGLEPDQAVRRFLQRRRAELARAADRPRSI